MRWSYSVGRRAVNLFSKCALGMAVDGLDEVPPSGGLIVAANHISFWDPPLLGAAMNREVYYVAKEELFRNPLLGTLIRAFNAIPISRERFDRKGLFAVLSCMRAGGAVLIFPEGGRNLSGELKPPRTGVAMMAMETSSPIVPAYISGSNTIKRAMIRRARIRISFGPAIQVSEFPPEGRDGYRALSEEVMKRINSLKKIHDTVSVTDLQ